jgi:putative DNA primase/helicase
LQEWFGYVISGRLDLQKILLLIGRTRIGKGVSARVLGKLIGRENVAGPTLSLLGANFGLAPLIGKPLAVVADARLDVRSVSSNAIVERLLSISGEDSLTVDIKYQQQCRIPAASRFIPDGKPSSTCTCASSSGCYGDPVRRGRGSSLSRLVGHLTPGLPW